MTIDERAWAESVRSFRRATDAATDGRATRARVLAAVSASGRRRAAVGRLTIGLTMAIVIALSGSAAWTAIRPWLWPSRSRPAPDGEKASPTRPGWATSSVGAPATILPAAAPAAPNPPAVFLTADDAEARDYGRAHRAHFAAHDPQAALVLWNVYLRRYPTGVFVPEARFNRALCLLRLGRRDAAAQALRPFAAGVFGAYRTREARTALVWIGP